jgi:hypothetical protein
LVGELVVIMYTYRSVTYYTSSRDSGNVAPVPRLRSSDCYIRNGRSTKETIKCHSFICYHAKVTFYRRCFFLRALKAYFIKIIFTRFLLFVTASRPNLGPTHFLSNVYRDFHPRDYSGRSLKLTTNLHLAPSLRILGAITPLP